ncbi:MAG TPA: hypothetical protein VF092_28480 [Longimicrobium sp.]
MQSLSDSLFRTSELIRYVALYQHGQLHLAERPGLRAPSASESDRYEELIVNPAVLVLTRQRGEIDCGGLEYVLIRYGSFFQLVHAIPGGHLSVAFEPEANPLTLLDGVRRIAAEHGLRLGGSEDRAPPSK